MEIKERVEKSKLKRREVAEKNKLLTKKKKVEKKKKKSEGIKGINEYKKKS